MVGGKKLQQQKTPKSGSWFDPSVWTFKSYDVNGKYNEQDIEELDD